MVRDHRRLRGTERGDGPQVRSRSNIKETALHRRGLRHSASEMNKENTYEPLDQNFITIGSEHFRCAEVLLLSDFVQKILLHCHRREEDRSECSKETALHWFWIVTQSSKSSVREKTCDLPWKTSSFSLPTVPLRGSVIPAGFTLASAQEFVRQCHALTEKRCCSWCRL